MKICLFFFGGGGTCFFFLLRIYIRYISTLLSLFFFFFLFTITWLYTYSLLISFEYHLLDQHLVEYVIGLHGLRKRHDLISHETIYGLALIYQSYIP